MPSDATAPRDSIRDQANLRPPQPAQTETDESGQTMAEYALITALIALVVAGAIGTVGNPAIVAFYTKLSEAFPD